MSSSLKAVIVQSYSGNALLSLEDGCSKTDTHLISSFFNAFDNFSNQVFGGGSPSSPITSLLTGVSAAITGFLQAQASK